MITLKEHLTQLFKNKNTKSYIRILKSNKDLYNEVSQYQINIDAKTIMETLWCIFNDTTPKKCECGNYKLFNTFNLGYRNYCGNKCTARWNNHSTAIKNTWNDSEKLESMIKKKKDTCLKKYGVENPIFKKEIQEKIKSTNLLRYGVSSPFESETIREKANLTFKKNNPDVSDKMVIARNCFVKKHGVNPFALDDIKDKIKNTRYIRYGYTHALQKHLPLAVIEILESKEKFIETLQNLTIAEAGERLGVYATTIARRAISYDCKNIFSTVQRSKWEFKIKKFLLDHNLKEGEDFVCGDRVILDGKELDFYFPKIKSAIEVGSIFWHSELNAKRDSKYHFNKWNICKSKGINLYQYWDYELQNSWDVIASKIQYIFNCPNKVVGARKIKDFKKVPILDEKFFLNKYHIQGFTGDRRKTFGAYYNNELIAVIGLAIRDNGVEIVRFATDLKASYPGLFSKLLKYSLTEMGIQNTTLLSFSDNRHSSGNLYFKSGFIKKRMSPPTYYYTKNYHSLENKKKFTKQKIASKFNVDILEKTEWNLMQELGYDRIWDAGKILWQKEIKYEK